MKYDHDSDMIDRYSMFNTELDIVKRVTDCLWSADACNATSDYALSVAMLTQAYDWSVEIFLSGFVLRRDGAGVAFPVKSFDSRLEELQGCVMGDALRFERDKFASVDVYRKIRAFSRDLKTWLRFAEVFRTKRLSVPPELALDEDEIMGDPV